MEKYIELLIRVRGLESSDEFAESGGADADVEHQSGVSRSAEAARRALVRTGRAEGLAGVVANAAALRVVHVRAVAGSSVDVFLHHSCALLRDGRADD